MSRRVASFSLKSPLRVFRNDIDLGIENRPLSSSTIVGLFVFYESWLRAVSDPQEQLGQLMVFANIVLVVPDIQIPPDSNEDIGKQAVFGIIFLC